MKAFIKILASLFFLTSISTSALACKIKVTAINNSDVVFNAVRIKGPWGRESSVSGKSLQPGETIKHTFTGSAFTCHGDYWLTGSITKDISSGIEYAMDENQEKISEDAVATVTITNVINKEKSKPTDPEKPKVVFIVEWDVKYIKNNLDE